MSEDKYKPIRDYEDRRAYFTSTEGDRTELTRKDLEVLVEAWKKAGIKPLWEIKND